MRIVYKLPLALVAFAAAFCGAMLAFEAYIVEPGLDRIEYDSARRDQDRVLAAIDRESKHLALLTRDWGQWEDAWRYAAGENPRFIEANIDAQAYTTAQVDLIAIFGKDRKALYAGRDDPESPAAVDGNLAADLDDNDELFRHGITGREDRMGLLKAGRETFIVASSPILMSDGGGTPRGSFVMGRRLGEKVAASLSEQTGVSLEFLPGEAAGKELGKESRALRKTGDGLSIEGLALIKDLSGAPALVARTLTPRDISTRGLATVRLFRDALFACCLLFSFMLAFGLDRLVSRPMAEIRRQIGRLKDGERLELPRRLSMRRDEAGDLANALAELSASLTQKRKELQAINSSLEAKVMERTFELSLLANVVESTSESVVLTDLSGTIVKVNEALCANSGFSPEELLGQNPRIMKSNRHDADFYEKMWHSIVAEGTWSGEIWDRRKNGEVYPKWLTINRIVDADGKPRNYVGVSADITEIKASEERLHKLAYYDPLTGLPNRTLFRDRLDKAISRSLRFGSRMAVIFIDLDHFKYVNDSMGHAVGDMLLVEAARRFSRRIRESDSVCRLGGDEFTLILERISSSEDAAKVAEGILADLSAPMNLGGKTVFIGASLGISIFPFDDTTAEGLTRKADAAMYCAKEAGRNTYRFVSGGTDDANRKRLEIHLELRRAFEESELLLFFQPILDPSGREIRGAEALLRWRRPGDENPSLPERSIDLAEESGLIVKIGDFVMREACFKAEEWRTGGRDIRVSVNISARQFEHAGLVRLVGEALEASGLPARLFEIEITESALMADAEGSLRTLIELKAMGVGISIDDFGTGYASLSYLSRFPVDRLKIGRGFVSAIGTSRKANALVEALLAMAKSLEIATIAEGVETEEQREFLAAKGCAEIQGFLFSHPIPPDRFASLLR